MPVRVFTLAALAVALNIATPASGHASPDAVVLVVPSADSARTDAPSLSVTLRSAYQAAWVQRQAGEYELSIQTSDAALQQVGQALSQSPTAAERRDLVELQSRFQGIRDAAEKDLEKSQTAAAGQGDADDDQVLNSQAIEDIEPQFNADVYRYIEFFTGAGRSQFERWLKRSGRYMKLFRSVLRKEGLPPDLAHLVFVESGFNVNARSVSAAVGPWQFLRSTGRLFGLTVNQWVDERKDPEKSTVAAARYLKHLYSIFGDWPLSLAAYNAGEGTVLRAIKLQHTTNYWDLRLPRQTEDYVPQFMAVLAISRDPQKYGFDSVEMDDPMEFDELVLKGAVDLRAIARLAGCSTEDLRKLNPAVRHYSTKGRDDITCIRVPPGKAEVVQANLENGAKLPAVRLSVKHRVRRGETLSGIGARYHVSALQIARENGINKAHLLRVGQVLQIPSSRRAPAPELVQTDDPRASTAYVPERHIRPLATLDGDSEAEGRRTITVHRHETLSTIAEKYDVSVSDLMEWNHLRSSRVRRGMRLKIRTGAAALADNTLSPADSAQIAEIKVPARRHSRGRSVIVRRGDTLSGIAHRHRTTVSAIKRANGMRGNQIRAGQRLRLPSS